MAKAEKTERFQSPFVEIRKQVDALYPTAAQKERRHITALRARAAYQAWKKERDASGDQS
jgi:hypothetical protein